MRLGHSFLLVLLAACLGCSESDEVSTTAAGSGGTAEGVTGGSGGEGGAGGAGGSGGEGGLGRIEVAPTEGSLTLDYDIAVQGFGPGFVGAIDLTGGSGTVELGGVTYPAVVYERQLFGVWTLYQTFVVGPDRWYIVWAYCEGQDLAVMYFEGTDGTALDYEETVGSCAEGPGPVQASVSFPAVSMEQPALLEGFTVEGPEVSIHSGEPGMVNLGTPHVVLPFEQVDCTSGCGAPGWREIHAVLWDPAAARACFGIFYLFDGDPEILLAYALTLPDLSDPAGVLALEATWSHAP